MNTLTIAGFRWLERLGSGACGEVHRLCPASADAQDPACRLVCKVYRPEAVDASLLIRQWRQMEAWGAPAGLGRPLWWQWEGGQLLAFWPDPATDPASPPPPPPRVAAGGDTTSSDSAPTGPGPSGVRARVAIQPRTRPGVGHPAASPAPPPSREQPEPNGGPLPGDAPPTLEALPKRPDAATCGRWTADLLAAGAWLHRHGLVHGNLKSRHVQLRPEADGGRRPVLLDIGTGAVGQVTSLEWTDHLFFMPPDQIDRRRGGPADPLAAARSGDVHAMGVVLFRLWTGRLPRLEAEFTHYHQRARGRRDAPLANLPIERWQQALTDSPPPSWESPNGAAGSGENAGGRSNRGHDRALSAAQRAVIERCLELDPARRWPDLEAAWTAWQQAQAAAGPSDSPDQPAAGSNRRDRHSTPVWRRIALAAVAAALAAAGYAAMLQQRLDRPALEPAANGTAPAKDAAASGSVAASEPGAGATPPAAMFATKDRLLLHLLEDQLDGHRLDLPAGVRQPLADFYHERIARLESTPADEIEPRMQLARALEIRAHLLWLERQTVAADTAFGRAALVWRRLLDALQSGALAGTGLDPRTTVDAAELRLAAVHEARGHLLHEMSRPEPARDELLAAARLRNGLLARAERLEDAVERTRDAGRSWLAVAESRRELLDLAGAANALAEVDAMLGSLSSQGRSTVDQNAIEADAGLVWLRAGSLYHKGLLARSDGDATASIDRQHEAAELLVGHIARAVVVPVRFQRLLGQVYTELAEVLARVEGSNQAIDAHSAAIRHLFAVLDAEPGDRVARLYLARNYGELALIERDVDQMDEARRHLETAVIMLGDLVEEPASRPRETLLLAVLQAVLAELTLEQGDGERAQELVEESLARITARLDRDDDGLLPGERLRWRLREAELTSSWAGICLATGDRSTARQALHQAVDRWRDLRRSAGVDAAHAQRSLERSRRQLDELMGQMAPETSDGSAATDPLPDDLPEIPDTPELPVTPPALPPPPLLIPQPPP